MDKMDKMDKINHWFQNYELYSIVSIKQLIKPNSKEYQYAWNKVFGIDDDKTKFYLIQGILYFINNNFDIAIKLCERVNNAYAFYCKGVFYESIDVENAINHYLKAIEFNNIHAMFNLACFYHQRNNFEKAIELYNQVIYHNIQTISTSDAMFNLAHIYINVDIYKNIAKAITLYDSASKLNHPLAMNYLALFYCQINEKYPLNCDYDKAIELFQRSINLGCSDAMYNLAMLYHNNYQQKYEVIRLLSLASKFDHMIAINTLAIMYENDNKIKLAFELYNRGVELNDSNAMNNLAMMYKNGVYVNIDIEEACKLLQQSIKLGNSTAMFNLGLMYEQKLIKNYFLFCCQKNNSDEKALKYYFKAIKYLNPIAMNHVGYLYMNGNMVNKDYNKAIEYFEMAISLDFHEAIDNIKKLLMSSPDYFDKYIIEKVMLIQ
jgi:TPR repeat protein